MNQKKQFYIQTLGCQQNHSDSERVASVFKRMGYSPAQKESDASVVVVNSCAVKQSSMDRIYGRLRHWRPRQKNGELTTILTGCILQHDRERLATEFDHIVNLEDMGKLPQILGEGSDLDLTDYFTVVPDHQSEIKAFVPIMTGCDKFCTYCAVPYTRGREISRPVNDILDEVKALIARGYKEIMLLGQNVNSYEGVYHQKQEKRGLLVLNRKLEQEAKAPLQTINFPKLIELVADLPGDFWVRYTSPHPYDMSDELIDVMAKHPKICNGLNLPLQSGDDQVLKKMNRHYSVEHYLAVVEKIRAKLEPVYLSTDVIVGFPGETDEQFEHSLEVLQKVKYDMAFISQYSPRPGTVSERKFEDNISKEEKVRRDKALNVVLKQTALENAQNYLDKSARVLVDEVKADGELMFNRGRTYEGKPIQFSAARSYMGQFVEVKVVQVKPFSLVGELL